jgi:hypothetical protein
MDDVIYNIQNIKKTDVIFKISKFSHNNYCVKIFKIQDNMNTIQKSKSVLLTKEKLIATLIEFEKKIHCSLFTCVFNKKQFQKKNAISPYDTKNLETRKIKIEKFFYNCLNKQEEHIAVSKIENVLKKSMYDPSYKLCRNILKRNFDN